MVLASITTAVVSAGWAQTTRLEGIPGRSVAPPSFESLPLPAETRTAVEAAVKARDYTRAEEILVKEIDHEPKSYALLTFVGKIFFLDGKYLNCAIAMKKADRVTPLQDCDRYTLALAYVILNQPDWARAEFQTLNRSKPDNPLYIYWPARLDYDAMHFKAAAAGFERVLELDPKFMKAYDNLGLTYEALGDYDRAITTYTQAVNLNRQQASPSPWPPLNLGALLNKLDKFDQAEISLRESLRYEPRFPKAHYELGLLLEKQKKDAEAIQELQQAAQYDPAYPEPHYVLGRIYRRLGENDQADQEWKAFQKLKQEHPRGGAH